MTCGMAQGTELHFTLSGMKIQPISVDYESDKTEYDFARVEISRAAGDYINEHSMVPESVDVITGDRRLCNVYMGEDSLTLDDERAYLELLDARKVLERGIIDYQQHSTTLGNIVEWFREAVQDSDTGNVIKDVILVGDETVNGEEFSEDETTEDFVQFGNTVGPEDADDLEDGSVEKGIAKFNAWTSRTLNGLGPLKEVEEGGFDFDQLNLSQVLYQIEQTFQLTSYVTDDGILKVGDPEIEANLFAAGEKSNMWEVEDYNLTSNPNSIRMVQVKGGYTGINARANPDQSQSSFEDGVFTDDVQMWAFASTEPPVQVYESDNMSIDQALRNHHNREPVEGKVIPVRHTREIKKPALRQVAVRRLMKELIQKVTGSITINPLKSSTLGGYPHDIKVGDSIMVFPPQDDHCGVGTIPENLFTVTGIRHRLDGRKGWRLELQLSRIPRTPIYAAAHGWPRIPELGSEYEDYETYYSKTMNYDNGSIVVGQSDLDL